MEVFPSHPPSFSQEVLQPPESNDSEIREGLPKDCRIEKFLSIRNRESHTCRVPVGTSKFRKPSYSGIQDQMLSTSGIPQGSDPTLLWWTQGESQQRLCPSYLSIVMKNKTKNTMTKNKL